MRLKYSWALPIMLAHASAFAGMAYSQLPTVQNTSRTINEANPTQIRLSKSNSVQACIETQKIPTCIPLQMPKMAGMTTQIQMLPQLASGQVAWLAFANTYINLCALSANNKSVVCKRLGMPNLSIGKFGVKQYRHQNFFLQYQFKGADGAAIQVYVDGVAAEIARSKIVLEKIFANPKGEIAGVIDTGCSGGWDDGWGDGWDDGWDDSSDDSSVDCGSDTGGSSTGGGNTEDAGDTDDGDSDDAEGDDGSDGGDNTDCIGLNTATGYCPAPPPPPPPPPQDPICVAGCIASYLGGQVLCKTLTSGYDYIQCQGVIANNYLACYSKC